MKFLLPLLVCMMTAFSPPAGRPPTGPLERIKPRAYDITFEVAIDSKTLLDPQIGGKWSLKDAPIVMPIAFQSTFSRVNPDSLWAKLWYGTTEDLTLNQRTRLDPGMPFNTHLAVIPIPSFTGQSLRWQIGYRAQVWSSKIDDAAAARITWPREWPAEVQDGLAPQTFIESDDPLFAETVERVSEGKLRLVPPYLAAKDLIRHCINNIQVTGDGIAFRELRLMEGLELDGALAAARTGRGSPHDLVCVCVAMLRAANIPARPVIGMWKKAEGKTRFRSWAEFYLPGAGWIPFDPDELRGKGIRSKDVHMHWEEFGTMDDLNRFIPLSFHFIPAASVQSPDYPALWGWDPRPAGTPNVQQTIILQMNSRGLVQESGQGGY